MPFLHGLGVQKFGLNAIIRAGKGTKAEGLTPEELKELLPDIINKANELGMEFIWYTPTKYHQLNPVEMGLGIKSCSAARLTLAVEPDGSVLPCQSYFKPLGNALTDDFQKIWNSDLAKHLREPQLCTGAVPLLYPVPHVRRRVSAGPGLRVLILDKPRGGTANTATNTANVVV